MFTQDEARALVASVRLAQAWLDAQMAQQAQEALGKIRSVLPAAARAAADSLALYAPPMGLEPSVQANLQRLREAVLARHKLRVEYRDLADKTSQRVLRPLGCFYWGKVWTLAAWCEGRDAFRSFRIDRMLGIALLDEHFREEPDKSLAEFLRQVRPGPAAKP
jgi:predicted DNA-binding transcriptional regulator YafY